MARNEIPRANTPATAAQLPQVFIPLRRQDPEISVVSGLSFEEATRLLDWLERRGCTELQVLLDDAGTFSVRCTCPAGERLIRDDRGQVGFLPGPHW